MLRKAQIPMILAGMLVLSSVQSLAVSTVAVGTCLPAYPHFFTIQSAINASPLGGTVLVCPGVYPEKLFIFHPLTLRGVDSGGSNLALITMPTGGIGTQIYVQATNVNISDLTIDGSNNGATGCGQGPNGIYYFLSSGTINHVAIRNEIPSGAGLQNCFDGDGIYVATDNQGASNVTIENSSIHAFQRNGIEAYARGTSVNLLKNSIGGNTVGPAGNGIAVWFGASGNVSNNSVINVLEPVSYPNRGGAGFGIIVECSQGVTISGNTIGDTQLGIDVESSFCSSQTGNADANTILKNSISQTHIFDAVYVCGNFNLVEGNTINSTSEAAVRFDDGCNPGVSGTSNTFITNTVNEACTTALIDPVVSGANTIGSNNSYSVFFDQLFGTTVTGGFCSTSIAPASRLGGRATQLRRAPTPVVR